MRNKILAVGSHPDDIELGCGGTIVKHLELGDEVYAIIMTNGENGDHSPDKTECLNSLTNIGVEKLNIFFGNFPDGDLSDKKDVINFIENIIKKFNITKVYTHSPNDRHQDHRNCSNAVSSAARNVSEILLFEGPSTSYVFEPQYSVELSKNHMNKKIESLAIYKSQINKNSINLEWVKNLAKVRGTKNCIDYSEAFAINHILRKNEDV